jgi:hypothetical protein
MTRCPHCDHRWTPASPPLHCPECGAILETGTQLALLEVPADIIAGVRARFAPWRDRAAFDGFVLRNAQLVLQGVVCSTCGILQCQDSKRKPSGRPEKCITCRAAGCWGQPPKPKRVRAARARRLPPPTRELVTDGQL